MLVAGDELEHDFIALETAARLCGRRPDHHRAGAVADRHIDALHRRRKETVGGCHDDRVAPGVGIDVAHLVARIAHDAVAQVPLILYSGAGGQVCAQVHHPQRAHVLVAAHRQTGGRFDEFLFIDRATDRRQAVRIIGDAHRQIGQIARPHNLHGQGDAAIHGQFSRDLEGKRFRRNRLRRRRDHHPIDAHLDAILLARVLIFEQRVGLKRRRIADAVAQVGAQGIERRRGLPRLEAASSACSQLGL
jgi:hypothetical protein